MSWSNALVALAAGLLLSVLTSPVGVSGAVFLLPIQLDVLHVPSPAVTPTNLLFNVIAVPGALLRHWHDGRLGGPLTQQMLMGTLPGVVIGAVVRVFVVPGPGVFRLIVGFLLLPLGLWLCARAVRSPDRPAGSALSPPIVTSFSLVVGVVGGIYGIGGGSILGPILVGRGVPVAEVAPAALTSTFATSIVGAGTYALLAMGTTGNIAPDWSTGVTCGLGGLIGGYLGTVLQPYLPEAALRLFLGLLAVVLAISYLTQAAR